MNIATVRHLPIPEGESNHTLPYNNGVSLHVGPVRVLVGSAEAEIELFACYASVRSTARPPDAAKFTLTRWSASARDAAGAHTEGHAIGTEASIFARRLKLLNFLPSFTANFAPARKKKVAEGRLGARTPTRTAHCRRKPHGQPHGRQTLKRTKV